jgi:CRISPR-associated endonuclease/helicase Cas3
VTTQLVEAGVDIDFPLVWRALAPLDSIVQAAGRCNREGRLAQPGRVVIFRSAGDHLPPGRYTTATGQARSTLAGNPDVRPDDLALLDTYFTQLYDLFGHAGTDSEQIQAYRELRAFRTVSERFKLIEDDTISVIVPYGEAQQQRDIDVLCGRLRSPWEPPSYASFSPLWSISISITPNAFTSGLIRLIQASPPVSNHYDAGPVSTTLRTDWLAQTCRLIS